MSESVYPNTPDLEAAFVVPQDMSFLLFVSRKDWLAAVPEVHARNLQRHVKVDLWQWLRRRLQLRVEKPSRKAGMQGTGHMLPKGHRTHVPQSSDLYITTRTTCRQRN